MINIINTYIQATVLSKRAYLKTIYITDGFQVCSFLLLTIFNITYTNIAGFRLNGYYFYLSTDILC